MKTKLLKIQENSFIRNIFILASGTALAQIVNMIFSPLITRVYGPEAYGLMGTFTALVQIVSPIAALSYPIAIVLPEKDEEADNLVRLSIIVTIVNTVIIFILLFFFNTPIVKFFNIQSISQFLYLIPIVVFFSGFLQIIQQQTIRDSNFQVAAKANFIETLFINSGKFTIGLFHPSASILIFLTAFREGVRAFLMIIFNKNNNYIKFSNLTKDYKRAILNVAKKHKDFPMYRTPEITLNSLSESIPILLLTSFFGPASAGFYSIGRTVLAVPSTLITKSVGDVFYPRISQVANKKQEITPLIIKSTFYLFIIGLVPYGLVVLLGPSLFSFVFGQDWIIAGEYARWISFWSFFNFIISPCVHVLQVISAQRFQLVFTVIKIIVISFGFSIGYFVFNNDVIAVALFSILGSVLYLFLIIITILKSKNFDEINRL